MAALRLISVRESSLDYGSSLGLANEGQNRTKIDSLYRQITGIMVVAFWIVVDDEMPGLLSFLYSPQPLQQSGYRQCNQSRATKHILFADP